MFLALIAGAGFQDRPVVAARQDVRNYFKKNRSRSEAQPQHLREEEEPSY
jgi:hypothetical protein